MEKNKIGILIPAYNEEDTIKKVIKESKKYGEIIVLDDGSKDHTRKFAEDSGAIVFSHKKNSGLGCALRTLFAISLKKRKYVEKWCKKEDVKKLKKIPDFDILVTIDADAQHNPKDIPKLVKTIEEYADFVLGNRKLDMYPFYKQVGNKGLSVIINVLLGLHIHDPETGYRVIRKELLSKMNLTAEKYQIALDILSEAAFHNAKIVEVQTDSPIYSGRKFIDYLLCRARDIQGAGVLDGPRNLIFLLKKIVF